MQKLLRAQRRVASSRLTTHWLVQSYSMPFRFLSSMAPPKDDPGNLNVSHPTFKPNPLPQIPALPPPAQGWPTPWLGRSGIEEYLHPLYKRGWKPSVQESSVKVRRHEKKVLLELERVRREKNQRSSAQSKLSRNSTKPSSL